MRVVNADNATQEDRRALGLTGLRLSQMLMEAGRCVLCRRPVELVQVGRCVYGQPCAHRQYQGRIPT